MIVPLILVKNEEYWLPFCLESVAGQFERIVLYDIGSEDNTPNIIQWFVDKEKDNTEFFVRLLPHCDPTIQGIFRNSMIAEARSDWYMILDGDELYNPADIEFIKNQVEAAMEEANKLYGMFRRIEVSHDLKQQYDRQRTHHRIYHRTAIFKGTHPGERPFYAQTPEWEVDFPFIKVWHFHNATRSPFDSKVPSRIKRRSQHTYHPGNLITLDLLKEVPILKKPIENFAVSPELKELQNATI